MTRQKVAILGGGMAGLAAAYELSKTSELRDRFEVTVYQMGWRLGGKCATGRSDEGLIQEHGLHFWFGCYDNAFRMLKEVYQAWRPPAGSPLRAWTDALKPHQFTPLGDIRDGTFDSIPIAWPLYPGSPGDDWEHPSLAEMVAMLVDVISSLLRGPRSSVGGAPRDGDLPASFAGVRLESDQIRQSSGVPDASLASSTRLVSNLLAFKAELRSLRNLSRFAYESLVVLIAFAKGLVLDILLRGADRRAVLNDIDFRDWLVSHGAERDVVQQCTLVRTFYDVAMQYLEGDTSRPNFAASTAVVCCLRMVCTTRGSMIYRLELGMGEAVVAPIYEVLNDRGVRFEFFRKVKRLELSEDKQSIQTIHLSRQVNLKGGTYAPTVKFKGVVCWPDHPLWDQIDQGNEIQDADFESHWCMQPAAASETLECHRDFDHVVLAISMGAFKKLNGEPGLADELMAASPKFKVMTEKIGLIPTQAMELWCSRDLDQLGWQQQIPAAVAWPPPFQIWADMSQTLRFETHPADGPKSVQYFCGTYGTTLYQRPSSDIGVPQRALAEVRGIALDWLSKWLPCFLPAVAHDGTIDWNFLYVTNGAAGPQRFDGQYWRANIDPTECCPGSEAGSVGYRLRADESGCKNLYLAGCWVRTGANTTCVESAVMAGMQAARAICGSPVKIPGEHFIEGL